VSGQLHTPTALPPGKEPLSPLGRRQGGPQSRPGLYREVKILDPTWTRNSDPSVVQPVAGPCTDYAISGRYIHYEGPKILCTALLAVKNYDGIFGSVLYIFKIPNHSRPNLLLQFAKAGYIPAFVINDNHERHNDFLMLSYISQSFHSHTRVPFSVVYKLCNPTTA
jgi:hypothetical protein